jgi:outer membrane protein assembly factor BamB
MNIERQESMRLLLRAIFLVSLFAVLTAGAAGQNQKVMLQSNAQHTGVYDAKPIYRLQGVRFAFKTDGPVRSTAALADGVLCFGSGDGFLYAVDAGTGKECWRFKTGGAVHSSPAIDDGLVYFTSRDQHLYALNAVTGKEVWKFRMGNDLEYRNGFDYYLSSPTIVDGALFIGSGDGNLYAFDTKTHSVLWKYSAGSRIRSTPAVAGDLVLVGTMNGYVLALNKKNGSLKWKFATKGAALKIEDFGFDRSAVVSSPSIVNGIVTVGCRDGFLYAIDIEKGTQLWENDHKISWVLSTPAVAGGNVFAGSSDAQFLQCVEQSTGKEVWRFKTNGPVWSSVAIAGSIAYFGSNDGNLFALDRVSGAERWRFKTNDRIFSSPVAADGMVYFGSDDGNLYALKGSTAFDTSSITPRKVVFWDSKPGGGKWFSTGTDEWIRDYFKQEGYKVVDSRGLEEFMREQLGSKARSVVVFAAHRVPASLVKEESPEALIRKYLDAGGKIVWLGPDPIAWKRDSTGKMLGIDYSVSGKILGIKYPGASLEGIGWYGATLTEDGLAWGLRGWWVGLGWVDPGQVSTVLARDENGMASEWVKNYGGPKGTGLVQLWVPRDRHTDLYTVKCAAEYGIR